MALNWITIVEEFIYGVCFGDSQNSFNSQGRWNGILQPSSNKIMKIFVK